MNTGPIVQRNIIWILGFSRGVMPSKYLGVPLGVGKLKKYSRQELLDRMKQRFSIWVLQPLNFPSRMVLVKAALQDIPIYLFLIISPQIQFFGKFKV